MKEKNGKTARDNDAIEEILAELFPSDDNYSLVDLPDSYLAPIGSLISYTSVLGGYVTFYRGGLDGTIGISVRLGKRKRGLVVSGDDLDLRFLVQFLDGFKRVYLARLQAANSDSDSGEAPKAKKAKK